MGRPSFLPARVLATLTSHRHFDPVTKGNDVSSTVDHLPWSRGRVNGLVAALSGVMLVLVGGCASPPLNVDSAGLDPLVALGHTHSIVVEENGSVLVGTHGGVFEVSANGVVSGPLGESTFDAMGLTGNGEALYASGHPDQTLLESGAAPNLGLLSSFDRGLTWEPVAFEGEEDFHALELGPDGVLYGLGSGSTALRISRDQGVSWSSGGSVVAADLAATSDGRLYAATPEGVLESPDNGRSFTAVAEAPLLYQIDALAASLVGVDTDGVLWISPDGTLWRKLGSAVGVVQALAAAGDGRAIVVDDRGLVRVDADGAVVERLTSAPN